MDARSSTRLLGPLRCFAFSEISVVSIQRACKEGAMLRNAAVAVSMAVLAFPASAQQIGSDDSTFEDGILLRVPMCNRAPIASFNLSQ